MLALEEIAEPRLHLAGYRLNPRTNGPSASRLPRGEEIELVRLSDGERVQVSVPSEAAIEYLSWSPDGTRLAFSHVGPEGYELWVARVDGSGEARRVGRDLLNAAHGEPCTWMPSGDELLCRLIPPGREAPPTRPAVPDGPRIQEATGEPAPARTFQDLLTDGHDANLFEHYFTSQLAFVDAESGRARTVGDPAIVDQFLPSPDGDYIFVSRTVRPFSFIVPDRWRINDWFPREMEIWNRDGEVVREVASLPLEEDVPVDQVRSGPRGVAWEPGAPSALVWVEDVEGEVEGARDRVFRLADPRGDAQVLIDLEDRFSRMEWTTDGRGLVTEVDRYPLRAASWTRTWLVDAEGGEPRSVWDRSAEERYGDPGTPVVRGGSLLLDGDWIYLRGDGVTPDGERPFLDRMSLATLETERIWEGDPDRYEYPTVVATSDAQTLVIRSESPADPPNYHRLDRATESTLALTHEEDPAPQLQGVERHVLTYAREDGVRLAGVAYTPPGWDGETALPTVLWAYPREFVSPDAAAQVPGQDNRFTRISGASHMFFLLRGYAVFDGPSIAILGGRTANDRYVEQLISSTQAAVDAIVEAGIADRSRIGVGGHSYGGFMTANLLAHSDLFRAGIARSAAHNRTLTPFGFQNETRTLWEAPEVYIQMSPFLHAHQIEAPVLIMHGADDPNPGTFPVQSERMFHALKGLGKEARLVMLDYEDHGYGARESIFHAVAEMIDWFDAHVKNAGEVAAEDR
jgi:dipeptidyl aminopeptidase/acylaminoacyl peptidase